MDQKGNFSGRVLNLTLLLLSFIAAFILAELMVRTFLPQETGPSIFAYHPELGLIHVPNQHGRRSFPGDYNYHYTNNSLGLRGSRDYSEKSEGLRILLLGDSFTYGMGVNDEQTFAVLAEKKLKILDYPIEIINAGVIGMGTDYGLRFYNFLDSKFHSEVVVLCFFANDFQDNDQEKSYRINENGTISPNFMNPQWQKKNILVRSNFYNWLICWSHSVNLLKNVVVHILGTGALSEYNRINGGYSNEDNIKKTQLFIHKLKNETRKRNAAFYIFYIPDRLDVEYYRHNGMIPKDEKIIDTIAQDLGIDLISLTTRLSQERDLDRIYYHKDGHFTPTGHEIAASVLAPFLNQAIEKLPAVSAGNPGSLKSRQPTPANGQPR